jgi:uncharacterized RDD family membrane protein YckC
MKYKKRQEWFLDTEQTLATIPSRLIAMLIDLVIVFLIFNAIIEVSVWLGLKIDSFEWKNFSHVEIESKNYSENEINLIKIFFGFIPTIYFSLTTYITNGQSIGKKILWIKIVSIYHHRLNLWCCIERSLGYIASTLELGIGFLQIFWNSNRMTLHDKIAETTVIKTRKTKKINNIC